MRIAYIAAGAANMYCGSCLHDNTLAAALQNLGHETVLIPTYTPLRTEHENVSIDRVFYNGITIYLQQKFSFFRNGPDILNMLVDRSKLINLVSRFSASTNAKDLGELTVSVLEGENGFQNKELEKLVNWLKDAYPPEIILITNTMLAGLAGPLKRAFKVPVFCAIQGEDIFLDDLPEPYKSNALSVLRLKVRDVDGFISNSDFYAEYMANYLNVAREKIHVVRLGLNLQGYGEARSVKSNSEFIIGYLARICPEKGLHLLVEAASILAQKAGSGSFRVRVAGYLGKRDQRYFNKILNQVRTNGLEERFEFVGEVDHPQKIRFLNGLDVLSVPTVYREPKGLFALEALAKGVPIVQPAHGAFPELIKATGGGILVEPKSSQALAEGLHKLMLDHQLRQALGRRGRKAVHKQFSDRCMAEATVEVFRKYLTT